MLETPENSLLFSLCEWLSSDWDDCEDELDVAESVEGERSDKDARFRDIWEGGESRVEGERWDKGEGVEGGEGKGDNGELEVAVSESDEIRLP